MIFKKIGLLKKLSILLAVNWKKNILILGWSFKPNTNDSRESPAIYVARNLFRERASLAIFDPQVSRSKIVNDIENYWGIKYKEYSENILILDELKMVNSKC